MKQVSKSVFSIMIAVLLLMFSSIPVFAADSPSADLTIDVQINPSRGGTGTYEFESDFGAGENGGTLVHFEAKANDGYTFSNWTLEGNYTVVSGSLNDSSFTVEAFSDLVATPSFTENGNSGGGSSAGGSVNVPIDSNTSSTSPQTGDNNLLLFAGAVVVLAACGVFVVKRKMDKIEK